MPQREGEKGRVPAPARRHGDGYPADQPRHMVRTTIAGDSDDANERVA